MGGEVNKSVAAHLIDFGVTLIYRSLLLAVARTARIGSSKQRPSIGPFIGPEIHVSPFALLLWSIMSRDMGAPACNFAQHDYK